MNIRRAITVTAFCTILSFPVVVPAQTSPQQKYDDHEQAKAEQKASDHRHHTGAKIVAGSAAGGAVVGALKGGPVGAVVGAGVGAAGGAVANKARVHHDVKRREHHEEEYQEGER
jgi:hypothetical protein